jgi:ribosome-associated translation inhibitor RaiA
LRDYLVGALNPAAAILPVLLSSVANARMQARIDEALKTLQEELTKLEEKVARMSDAQYKIVCEALSHLHRTSDTKKSSI